MKQWTVTYREKSGLKTSVVIEAEDRAGVFAELKQRGINAISITEGAVKAKRSATSGGVSKGVWGVVAAVVAVALIGVVWMVMQGEEASVEVKKESKRSKEVSYVNTNATTKVVVNKDEEKVKPTEASADGKKDTTREAKTRERGQVWGTAAKFEEAKRLGKKPAFRFVSESYLAMYAIPGETVPPMPRFPNFEEDVKTALVTPIDVLPSDTPEQVHLKEIVAGMKEELRQFIKDGGTISQYYDELERRQEKEANYYSEAFQMVQTESKGEDKDFAFELWKKTNKHLQEQGIKQIPLPRPLWKTHKHLLEEQY